MSEFTERRLSMENDNMNSLSIEKFAAYLDGNLLPEEMQQISSLIEKDDMMQEVYGASKIVDETLANYTPDDLILPEEITSSDFKLPSFGDASQLTDLSDDYGMVACANADMADIVDPMGDDMTLGDSTIEDLSTINDLADDTNEIGLTLENDYGDILSDPNDY